MAGGIGEQPAAEPTKNGSSPAGIAGGREAEQKSFIGKTGVVVRPGGWRKVSKVSASSPPDVDDAVGDDVRCGMPGCHPECLQPCASIGGYMFLYSCVAIIQGAFFTYFVAVISTIEKRFGIKSRTTGFVMSGNEVSQILFSIVLNYYGGKGHRPRWLAGGMICVVICSVILASPHFLLGPGELYKAEDSEHPKTRSFPVASNSTSDSNVTAFMPAFNIQQDMFKRSVCKASRVAELDLNLTKDSVEAVGVDCEEDYDAKVGMSLLFIAHFVSGIGLCLFYPLSWSFYDDNVHPKHAPFFHGFSSAVRVIGPFFGFVLAYGCLQIYVVPDKDPGLSPYDPRWLGAWWLGFVMVGGALLVCSGLMALFPRRIPTKYSNAEAAKKKLQNKMDENQTMADGLKEIPRVLKRLAKNRIYMYHMTAVCLHVLGYVGFFSFSPKYLEAQFRVTAAKSSIGSGVAGVLVQVFGMMASGYVFRKYKPRAEIATGYGAFVSVVSACGFIVAIFIGCPNLNLHGKLGSNGMELASPCNADCHCPTSFYNPVCTEDGAMHFFSPCHAGCTSVSYIGDPSGNSNKTIYGNCLCIQRQVETETGFSYELGSATHGFCDADSAACNTFLTYLVVLGFVKLISSTGRIAGLMITMRCVEKRDKSVALACMVTAISIFATIPGPILYGAIIDSTCLVWKTSKCGSQGNCAFYDGDKFRINLHAWTAGFILCAVVFEMLIVLRSRELDLYGEKDDKELAEVAADGKDSGASGRGLMEQGFQPLPQRKTHVGSAPGVLTEDDVGFPPSTSTSNQPKVYPVPEPYNDRFVNSSDSTTLPSAQLFSGPVVFKSEFVESSFDFFDD